MLFLGLSVIFGSIFVISCLIELCVLQCKKYEERVCKEEYEKNLLRLSRMTEAEKEKEREGIEERRLREMFFYKEPSPPTGILSMWR